MSYEYLPRNDHVLLECVGDRHLVKGVGPLVEDLRQGDYVVVYTPEDEDEGFPCTHSLTEDGNLFLVREHLVLAVERQVSKNIQEAYEEFHS